MALRLIEMVIPESEVGEIESTLQNQRLLDQRKIVLPDQKIVLRILVQAERCEEVLDLLEKQVMGRVETRVLILPVEATLPRAEEESFEKKQSRIDRDELYEKIKDAACCSRIFLAMIVLSTVVAAIGLYSNNVVVIIGAMVIAPLLGSNMALSFGTTLGDLSMIRRALLTGAAGTALVMALSIPIGFFLGVDGSFPELILRTHVGWKEVVVALASGCAGALAFTTGLSETLIGVMVAVAVLPSLVASGLFFGSGEFLFGSRALLLFALNIIGINLAGVLTFLVRGIHPATWWEKDRAARAVRIAILLWAAFLGSGIALFFLLG